MEALYRDPQRSIDERVEDLFERLTLEEKIGQLMQLDGRREEILDEVREMHLGSILCVHGEDTVEPQRLALASRLGIPLLVGIDAIHGHSFKFGATMFPSQLGQSCAWNEALIEQTARVTAVEASYTGVHWTFSPVFCMPRDLRWGRVNETFGEDPLLIGRFGAAMVRGYQGESLADPRAIAACAKHYAGYGETLGGRDASEASYTRRKMRSYFLPPFAEAVKAGVATFMTAYHAIDGVPCTANRWLLTEVLREEWGYDGMVVTDWNNAGWLVTLQRVCATHTDAAQAAVHAGNDMMMSTPEFYQGALAAVREQRLAMADIDQAVRRVLRLKFQLGLFENPRLPDPEGEKAVLHTPAHRDLALQSARESVVLLKNAGVLPLDMHTTRKIAVIGPNADNADNQLGDWSLGESGQTVGPMARHRRADIVTVLDGLQQRLGQQVEISYAEGCGIKDAQLHKIPAAVRAAQDADVVVLVIGDQDYLVGECKSTATLELMGGQQALFDALHATGTPLVVILLASKPLAIPHIAAHADSLLCAFSPGMEGGTAIAEILAGDINPSGKLTISFPHHVGQQPVCYNQPGGEHGTTYPDLPGAGFSALFPFGFGLSYAKYRYRHLHLASKEIKPGQAVEAEIEVLNISERDGVEIVQCYLEDKVTSATWPAKILKDYQRVPLRAGEAATVRFTIPFEHLSIVDADGNNVVEPGDFTLKIGGSSRDGDLTMKSDFCVVE